jgi:hypothetical protein
MMRLDFVLSFRDFYGCIMLIMEVEMMIKRGDPGIEPGTSCTLNRNHTTRPIALIDIYLLSNP